MNYEIVNCWLVFDTDAEGDSNGNLRFATVYRYEVEEELARNSWSSVKESKAIDTGKAIYVLAYLGEIKTLGDKHVRERQRLALVRLTPEDISALKKFGFEGLGK